MPFTPIYYAGSPSLGVGKRIASLPIFLSLLRAITTLHVLLYRSTPRGGSGSSRYIIFVW